MVGFGLAGINTRTDDPRPDRPRLCNMAAVPIEDVLAGRPATFSWQELLNGKPSPADLRRFIEATPVLDYAALEPGERRPSDPATRSRASSWRRVSGAACG